MTTPAQASGVPDFVTDWPVQGPTDQGIREADCWFARNRIPTPQNYSCVDCEGQVPMFARSKGLLGERVSLGGFALAAAGDPDIWGKLSLEQQTWVGNTLAKLNELIVKTTGTTCPQWTPTIHGAGYCFQTWFNSSGLKLTKPDGSPVVLRSDGIFDQDTLDALRTTVALNQKDFPTPFPGTALPGTTGEGKKLSTGAMVGIGTAGAAVLGGIIYAATRGGKRKRRSRR